MPKLINDLLILWIFILVFCFAFLFFGTYAPFKDKEQMIETFGGIGVLLIFGIIVTILQLTGIIKVW